MTICDASQKFIIAIESRFLLLLHILAQNLNYV